MSMRTSRVLSRPSSAFALATAIIAGGSVASAAHALECPVAHAERAKGVLQETPETIAALSKSLADRGAGAAPGIVAGLRQRHPTATNGELVNYLVTAYCPVVNREVGKSEAAKRAQLAHFNKAIVKLVYP